MSDPDFSARSAPAPSPDDLIITLTIRLPSTAPAGSRMQVTFGPSTPLAAAPTSARPTTAAASAVHDPGVVERALRNRPEGATREQLREDTGLSAKRVTQA